MGSASMRFFGSELRRARDALGMTQKQLGESLLYSESKIGAVERGEQLASRAFAERADAVLKTDGLFSRMRENLLTVDANPRWFQPWVDYERDAVEINWYEPLLVPGLVQSEAYARALIEDGSPGQVESLLAARMERQQILHHASVTALIDESVLWRRIGTREVMHEQLMHLTRVPAVVQVMSTEAETYRHLLGSFALAVADGAEVGYVETPVRGCVLDDPEIVSAIKHHWQVLRAEALPRGQSRRLILKVAEAWKTGH